MHVLIIEDDALIALNLQMFLEELGADSTALAASQADAVREAFDHRPDLIASDVKLTEGTGPEAVKVIRSRLGDIPAIYITGNPEVAHDADPSAKVLHKADPMARTGQGNAGFRPAADGRSRAIEVD